MHYFKSCTGLPLSLLDVKIASFFLTNYLTSLI